MNVARFMIVCAMATFTMSSCAQYARFYPANDIASKHGVLRGEYMMGKIKIVMPDGEVLEGEYSTVDTSTTGFGEIYASVFGSAGVASGSATGTYSNVPGSNPGFASLFGSKGTRMECEYFVNTWTGKGGGACRTSGGALYRVHF